MECKADFLENDLVKAFSINRNIVECKVGKSDTCAICLACINRNIVECKEGEKGDTGSQGEKY